MPKKFNTFTLKACLSNLIPLLREHFWNFDLVCKAYETFLLITVVGKIIHDNNDNNFSQSDFLKDLLSTVS